MALSGISFFGIILNVTIFMFGMAVALITFWQNARARTNLFFGLTGLSLGIWGIPNGLFYAARQFDLDPDLLLNLGSTTYISAVLMFLFFLTELDIAEDRPHVITGRIAALIWVFVALVVVWSGAFWTESTLRNEADYTFSIKPLGLALYIVAVGIIGATLFALREHLFTRYRQMVFSQIPLFIGITCLILLGAPLGHVLNGIGIFLAMLVVARLVLRDRLFNPLVELYSELTVKNTQLEEASKRKSEFLANMSHELRTPLNSIIGYTELILQGVYGKPDSRLEDRLNKVRKNGKDLLILINDVLDLSKIDAGRLDLNPTHLAPVALVNEVVNTLQSLADAKKINLTNNYQDLPMIYVDELRTRQIVLNGMANMIKFTGEGHALQIGGFFDAIRNQVVVTMRASSGGMSNADTYKIRQALSDNDELPSAQFADFGLGLAVSKRLTELHGGRIWFDSMSNTFNIGLPAAAELKRPTIASATPTTGEDKRPLILVIDDDADAIEVIQGYLEPAGYRMFGALSGHEGILRARELAPALITLDAQMPGLDGWAVLDVLNADDILRKIPVIMISISDQHHMVRQFENVIEALTKPVTRNALLNILQNTLVK